MKRLSALLLILTAWAVGTPVAQSAPITEWAPHASPRADNPLLLGMSIHVEGFQQEARDEDQFDRHVEAITSFAEIAADHGAILTMEFSEVFLDAAVKWDSTVIDELKSMGHGTAVHADVGGQGDPTLEEMVEDLERQRAKAEPLGVDLRHVSGVCSRGPWVEAVIAAGYQSNNGPVEYCALSLDEDVVPSDWDLSGCTTPSVCHGQLKVNQDLIVHPYFIDSSSDFIIPKESGLVFIIGDSGSTAPCKAEAEGERCAGNSADIPYIEDTLQEYLDARDPDRVAVLSLTWSIGTIPDDAFVDDVFNVYDDVVASGQAKWMSNGDIGQAVIDAADAALVSTETLITKVKETSSGKTKVTGTVTVASGSVKAVKGGTVDIKVKKRGGSWKLMASGEAEKDGSFTVKIKETYPAGTKFKAAFKGTDDADSSTSKTYTS